MSILSVLLKAREYDKNIFSKDIIKNLNIMSIQESNSIEENIVDNFTSKKEKEQVKTLLDNFQNAKEIGSLLILEKDDYTNIENTIKNDNTIFADEMREKILPLIKVARILTNKYDIVVTNPPYMNSIVMPKKLKDFLRIKYNNFNSDIYVAFIKRMFDFTKKTWTDWNHLSIFLDVYKNI